MRFDGKSYPAERMCLAWSLSSAGSLSRAAAFLIASLTDSKGTCERVANSKARRSFCSAPLKNCHFTQYHKDHNGEENLAPYFQWGKQNTGSFNSCRYIIHHYQLRFEFVFKICSNSSRNVALAQEFLGMFCGGQSGAGQGGRWSLSSSQPITKAPAASVTALLQ